MGEASGTVNVKTKNGTRVLSRVSVCFYRNDHTLVGRTLTEEDGYYSYMGLQPGKYLVRLDSSQLTKIRMAASPEFKWFTVATSIEGDFVEGLDFTLQSIVKDSTESVLPKINPNAVPLAYRADSIINYASKVGKLARDVSGTNKQDWKKDSILPGVRYSKGVPTTDNPDLSSTLNLKRPSQITVVKGLHYAIQVGAYIIEGNAIAVKQKVKAITGLSVNIVSVDGLYKIWIEGFKGRRQAERFVKKLSKMGFQSYVMMVYR